MCVNGWSFMKMHLCDWWKATVPDDWLNQGDDGTASGEKNFERRREEKIYSHWGRGESSHT